MDFAGLVGKFSVNRALTDSERQLQLQQKQRLEVAPHYQLSVIEMNSTYLETVDKWYGWKGTISAVTLAGIGMILATLSGMLYVALTRDPSSGLGKNDVGTLITVTLMSAPVLIAAALVLRRDSFAFTHYPTRFDRNARMVHVFRTNGTVLSVPWDDIFFTLACVDPFGSSWNVLGHVLDKDKSTVKESFALSISTLGVPEGQILMRSHWEFIRRYMEEGPAAVTGQVEFCLPIKVRRETIKISMDRLLANTAGLPILVQQVAMLLEMLVLPFRIFAMRTSKLPHWPADIDAASPVQQGDPYAIVGGPDSDRIALFPEAAAASGVRFTGPPDNPLAHENRVATKRSPPASTVPMTRLRNRPKRK